MMNKKGQTLSIAIVTALFTLLVGMTVVNFLMPEITNARTNLNCSDVDNIQDGNKLMCLMFSATVPYFFVIIFSAVVGLITARLTL